MVGRADLAIYQGDDWAGIVTVYDGGAAAVLTGYLPQAQIRLGPADTNPKVLVEIAAALDTTITGQINLSIPSTTTTYMSGSYAWDLQLTTPTGVIMTLLAGQVVVTQEITREAAA